MAEPSDSVDINTATSTPATQIAPATRNTSTYKSTTSTSKTAVAAKVITPPASSTKPSTETGQPRRYTQKEIDSFNSDEQPFPSLEPNPDFNNTLSSVVCGTCAPKITTWWSSLTSRRLVSASDLKEQVKQLCRKCSSNTKTAHKSYNPCPTLKAHKGEGTRFVYF